jgi:hypothetical protein
VRTQKQAVDELFDAGDALQAAQDRVLAGKGNSQSLRTAADRERAAVDGLVGAARGLLTAEGHELSRAVIERVGNTLHAAALDEDAREQMADGRLQRELQHVGFGPGMAFGGDEGTGAAKTSARPQRTPEAADRKQAAPNGAKSGPGSAKQLEKQREERKRAERERAATVRAARSAEADARRAAARAQRALELAQERRDRAAEALTEAEQELEQARAEAEETADAHRRASEELERLGRR